MNKILGIDIYNGNSNTAPVDFAKLQSAGVQFALLKASYGSPCPEQVDKSFKTYYNAAKAVGMPVGAYHFLYARDVETAKVEAQFFLDTIASCQFEYPVMLDVEDDHGSLAGLDKATLTDIVIAWLDYVQSRGYYVTWYANPDWRKNRLDVDRLAPYDPVLACYDGNTPDTADYSAECGIWQYSDKGVLDGITEHYVDMDVAYKDYPEIIKAAGLNGWGAQDVPTDAPQPEPAPEPEQRTEQQTYTVQSGDTMWGISQAYGMSLDALVALNPQISDPANIYPGEVINVSGSAVAPAEPEQATSTYTVQSGDTLWDIAADMLGNGSRYPEIKRLNGLGGDTIYPGQTLQIPQ